MTHAEARHALTLGLEKEMTELRRQRPARRIAEIAFFVALYLPFAIYDGMQKLLGHRLIP